MEKSQASWMCLEGNPRVFTNFATRLGYPTLLYRFYDVYALDSEVWKTTIPEPVIAIILLYSIKDQHKDMIAQEVWEQKQDLQQIKVKIFSTLLKFFLQNQSIVKFLIVSTESPLFIKQNIANACGVISLLHALCNTVDRCGGPIEGSYLDKFMKVNKNSTPEERGAYLSVEELNPEEPSNAVSSLHEVNQEFVSQSDAQPKADQPPGHFYQKNQKNFVCYMEKNGCIWELDGRMQGPVNKGRILPDHSLGSEVSKIIQRYIDVDPEETKYSVMALAPNYFDEE